MTKIINCLQGQMNKMVVVAVFGGADSWELLSGSTKIYVLE